MNSRFFASHSENAELAAQVATAATAAGKGVRHNVTSYSNHDGYHRYVIFSSENPSSIAYNSKDAEIYYEDRYSKDYKPSKSGEAASLRSMLSDLTA